MKGSRFRAQNVLSYYGLRMPPIDPWWIAREMGLEVHEVCNPGWSGALQSERWHAVAWLCKEEHSVLKRFTLAHEIGHLLLHPTGEMFRDVSFAGNSRETDANNFAADLLMPLPVFDEIARHLDHDVERLAEAFQVTRRAVINRLTWLGVFLE